MVTEILRPINVEYDSEKITLVPSSTEVEDAYRLINEDVADDDGTYISITETGTNNAIKCYFEAPKRKSFLIDSVRFVLKVKTETSELALHLDVLFGDNEDEIETFTFDVPQDWETLSCNGLDVSTYIEDYVMGYSENFSLCLKVNSNTTSSSSKNSTLDITQIYVEITYAVDEETIYFKENGSWNAVKGIIYRNTNGQWYGTNSGIFENGDKYIFQNIT